MKKIKLISVLGTRPEIIRLSQITPLLDKHFDHKLIYTNQNYDHELSTIFFQELNLRTPDKTLQVRGNSLAESIANILKQTEEVFLEEKPDALLVLGDTNSSLCSIIAKRLGIFIFHMEAGNRSFDDNVPEEINRRIIDHTSDINLAYSEVARRNLLHEGVPAGSIYVTGSPMAEVIKHFIKDIEASPILSKLGIARNKYFLLSMHREENIDNPDRLHELLASMEQIVVKHNLPLIVSLHPRTKKKLSDEDIMNKLHPLIQLSKPFGFFDYVQLQKNALCVLSDSGSIPEEASIIGFKAVQIRVSTERQEAYDKGSIILSGFNRNSILNAVEISLSIDEPFADVPDYSDTNVSAKVTKLIHGLTSIKKYNGRLYY